MRRLLVACVLAGACSPESGSRVETFGYVFHETTGITTRVLEDGKESAIRFAPGSDPIALRMLTSLDWRTLYPNGNGGRIFVEGELGRVVHWTAKEPDKAQSEPYREFRLADWYIVTPYERMVVVDESVPQESKREVRQSLGPDDFGPGHVAGSVDLARFQRKRAP